MSRLEPDEVLVDRAVWEPGQHWLNLHERRAVALRLTQQGMSAAEIAARLEVAPRTVHRWRSEDRAVQGRGTGRPDRHLRAVPAPANRMRSAA